MKPSKLTRKAHGLRRPSAAFTLIELLTVMAIIVLLASLILGIANHAQYKSSLSRAQAEIRAFETAIESYKVDNGSVPRDPTTGASVTDLLNPQLDFYPDEGKKYKDASHYLYLALSGFEPGSNFALGTQSPTKNYMTFQPNQLEIYDTERVKNPLSPHMYLVDPFGFSYGYSTAYQAEIDKVANSSSPGTAPATPAPGYGYNNTYDVWSTAGYAHGGKGTPTNNANASPSSVYSNLWLKNW